MVFVETHIAPVAAAEERACASFPDTKKEVFLKTFRTLVDRLKTEISEES